MSTVFFASGGGGNLSAALALSQQFPELLAVELVVTDRLGVPAIEIARAHGIEVFAADFEGRCGRFRDVRHDAARTQAYHAAARRFHDDVLAHIVRIERKRRRRFDLAVLAYRRWIHGALLQYFDGRMINQHPGDLTVKTEPGGVRRRYVGITPVRDALEAGERRTRTSTFVVRDNQDGGEILSQGPWVRFEGDTITREAAHEHELRQKSESDWPSLRFALYHIARGQFALAKGEHHLDGNCVVYLGGAPLPYGGVSLSASPGEGANMVEQGSERWTI